jgi:uncharacterized SAM-binding protein YcdF (DUF218 family)
MRIFLGFFKWLFILLLALLFVLFCLSFTSIPFWAHYRLGTAKEGVERHPDYIILLGGSGMPSQSNLIRAWYAARLAKYAPSAKVIIALPGNILKPESSINLVKRELILHGVDSTKILFEPLGTNTRAQALNILRIPGITGKNKYSVIVTSPEHLYRAWRVFRKAGLDSLGGVPAFENPNESDISFDDSRLGGRKGLMPKIGNNLALRYNFWTQLDYEVLVLREYAAIAFYKIKGWI